MRGAVLLTTESHPGDPGVRALRRVSTQGRARTVRPGRRYIPRRSAPSHPLLPIPAVLLRDGRGTPGTLMCAAPCAPLAVVAVVVSPLILM